MGKPIPFEYQNLGEYTLVALDSRFSDYDFKPVHTPGKGLEIKTPGVTVKDCRNIDGCVYLHLGHVSDAVMVDLIGKFLKLKQEGGWTPHPSTITPDPKFHIEP